MNHRYRNISGLILILLTARPGLATGSAADFSNPTEKRVLEIVNDIRTMNELQVLTPVSSASESAHQHAGELKERRTLSHRSRDGSRVAERYRAAGGTGLKAGENLGAGDSINSIVEAWMQSPSHRSNLLNPEWYSAGVGHAQLDGDRIVLVMVFSNSRWEQTSLSVMNGNVALEGVLIPSPDGDTESIYLTVDGGKIFGESSGTSRFGSKLIRFGFPEPGNWRKNEIAAMTLTLVESGVSSSTDLLFLPAP